MKSYPPTPGSAMPSDPRPEPDYAIGPVGPSDGPQIAKCLINSFASDAFTRASFPNTPLEDRIADLTACFTANFFAPTTVLLKAVDSSSGEIVGYAKWEMSAELAQSVKAGLFAEIGEEVPLPPQGADLERRDPLGLNEELAVWMSDRVVATREGVLNGRERIGLALIATLPSHRGRGVATRLLRWGCSIADRHGLPIWNDASPMALDMYRRLGFKVFGSVITDLSLGTAKGIIEGKCTHECMLREPSQTRSGVAAVEGESSTQ